LVQQTQNWKPQSSLKQLWHIWFLLYSDVCMKGMKKKDDAVWEHHHPLSLLF
jgi:hypothetical protein